MVQEAADHSSDEGGPGELETTGNKPDAQSTNNSGEDSESEGEPECVDSKDHCPSKWSGWSSYDTAWYITHKNGDFYQGDCNNCKKQLVVTKEPTSTQSSFCRQYPGRFCLCKKYIVCHSCWVQSMPSVRKTRGNK